MATHGGRNHAIVGLIVLLALLVMSPTSAWAAIATTGSVTPVWPGGGGDWAFLGDLTVGAVADGTLNVNGGSTVAAGGNAYLAFVTDATGTATIDGAGSQLNVAGMLTVGADDEGTLTVSGGAAVASAFGVVGGTMPDYDTLAEYFAPEADLGQGTGTVTITGDGSSWATEENIMVGFSGDGTVNVLLGGDVTCAEAWVGVVPGVTGTVDVSGAGSTWTITGDGKFLVGGWGTGFLTIENGGELTANAMYIGGMSPSEFDMPDSADYPLNGTGTVTVTDAGSTLTITGGDTLVVGGIGTGTLTISDGGTVISDDASIGGYDPDFDTLAEYFDPDADLGGGTGTVTVTGTGSNWQVASIDVGFSGEGTLTIADGGTVAAEDTWVGILPDAVGTVTISGAESTWTHTAELVVGVWGQGDVTIDGAAVTAEEVYIGGTSFELIGQPYDADLIPDGTGTVTVTGGGGLTVTGAASLYVGYSGTGTLDVNEAGQVSSPLMIVGGGTDAVGTVNVHDADSLVAIAGGGVVGAWGTGNVNVYDSGRMTAGMLMIGGFELNPEDFDPDQLEDLGDPVGTGTVTVEDDDSSLEVAGTLSVGYTGNGTLRILNGGEVTSLQAGVGVMPGSYGEVLVDESGDSWTNTQSLFVGGYGEGLVTVMEGGHIDVGDVLYIGGFEPEELGFDTGELGDPDGTGTVTVTGPDSLVEAMGIAVGVQGNGTLEILDGAEVDSEAGVVGMGENGVGLVTIDGLDSTWQIQREGEPDEVPEAQGEGHVVVSNGGKIGVDGSGILNVADDITLGAEGGVDAVGEEEDAVSQMTISDGGTVHSGLGIIGGTMPDFETLAEYMDPDAEMGRGPGLVTVTDDGSSWTVDDDLMVGFAGDGTLEILLGGDVTSSKATIGVLPGVTGTVDVNGPGSTWTVSGDNTLIVGAWGDGTLNIENGGEVTTDTLYVGGAPLSMTDQPDAADYPVNGTGTVIVTGGGSTLTVTGEDTLTVGGFGVGTMTISDGGTVVSDDASIGGYDPDFDTLAEYFDPDADLGGGTGTVTVTGTGSNWQVASIDVGFSGEGTLTIADGGTVAAEDTWVGILPDAVGTVTISGAESTWTHTAELVVGVWGQGDVTIDGAEVTAEEVYIGGASFDLIGQPYDADRIPDGTGTMEVINGGTLDVTGSETLHVGYFGTGTLDVNTGGDVTADSVVIGGGPDAVGTVTVDGTGSSLTADWEIILGAWGQGDMTISDGAEVTTATMHIGGFEVNEADFDPNMLADFGDAEGTGTVTVTGEGSSLDVLGEETLVVGAGGTGTLNVEDGGEVTSEDGFVGGYITFEDEGETEIATLHGGTGTATVTDPNSVWNSEILTVGTGGDGTLEVSAGGEVNSNLGVIGLGPDSTGEVTVNGDGSNWVLTDAGDPNEADLNGTLVVGAWGDGTLNVEAGGNVTATEMYIGGMAEDTLGDDTDWGLGDPNGTGIVTVTGDGSTLQVPARNTLYVGYSGDGTLNILDGGWVETDAAVVGVLEDGVGLVTIEGLDSTWQIQSEEELDDVPDAQGEGHVLVSNGGKVQVDGGGILNVADDITLGAEGGVDAVGQQEDAVSQMTVSNGGTVNSESGVIGGTMPDFETLAEYMDPDAEMGSGPGLATVTGDGSSWTVAEDLMVGFAGDGTLNVLAGGNVTAAESWVGVLPGVSGTVDVNAATLTVDETIAVGMWGDGNVTIENGGQATASDVYLGGVSFDWLEMAYDEDHIPNGTGTLTITGDNSQLVVTGAATFYAGYYGSGIVDVNAGGSLETETAGIAAMPGSTGTATIDGVGSLFAPTAIDHEASSAWYNFGPMFIGGYGVGSASVTGGGLLSVGQTLYIGGFNPDDFAIDTEQVGYEPNGTGSLVVSGEDSTVYVSGPRTLYVGYSGTGTMAVDEGGYVQSDNAGVAALPGSTGTVTIEGVDDEDAPPGWYNAGSMFVGGYGTGSLLIQNRGMVLSDDAVYLGGFDIEDFDIDVEGIGYEPNGTGTLTVTGTDSWLGTDGLAVGTTGTGFLNILAGGWVDSEVGVIGFGPDANGVAVVDGEGSTWQLSYEVQDAQGDDWSILGVGVYNRGSLTISNGGFVGVADAVVGGFDLEDIGADQYYDIWGDPAGNGSILVTGANSLLDVLYDLCIGHTGTGSLRIEDGGRVNSEYGYVGNYEGADGTVLITGENSLWQLTGDLFLGGWDEGSGGTGLVNVSDGGELTVGDELTVWETGTLTGDGTVNVVQVGTLHNYGTIAPGNDGIGTLTVNGDVVFYPGSTYAVQIGSSSNDLLLVDGDVTIDGGTVQAASQGTIVGTHDYEIIQGDSVAGVFDVLDTALLNFSFSDANLAYLPNGEPNSVWLHVAASNFNDPNFANTYNRWQVAGALQQIANGGGNNITNGLQNLTDPNHVRHSYDHLNGHQRPSLGPLTAAGGSRFLGMVTSRVRSVQGGAADTFSKSSLFAMAGPDSYVGEGRIYDVSPQSQTFNVGHGSKTLADSQWGLWGRGYAMIGDSEAGTDAEGYNYTIYGGTVGLDYQLSDTWLGGAVAGMSDGDVDFARSRDNTEFGARHLGLYASGAWEAWYLDAVGAYAMLDYDTERFVDLLGERLTASFNGNEAAGYVEVGRNWYPKADLKVQPLVSLQYTYVGIDSYTETGGTSALKFDKQTYESTKGSLGVRLTRTLVETMGDFRADVQFRGRWVHEFGDSRADVDVAFASTPAIGFNVRDNDISRDSAILGVGVYADLTASTRAYVDYDTRFNSDESLQVISASLQYRW